MGHIDPPRAWYGGVFPRALAGLGSEAVMIVNNRKYRVRNYWFSPHTSRRVTAHCEGNELQLTTFLGVYLNCFSIFATKGSFTQKHHINSYPFIPAWCQSNLAQYEFSNRDEPKITKTATGLWKTVCHPSVFNVNEVSFNSHVHMSQTGNITIYH